MHRRQLIHAGLLAAYTATAGCLGIGRASPRAVQETFDAPAYSDWVPAQEGLVFSHTSFELTEEPSENADNETTGNETNVESDMDIISQYPILGFPLYGGFVGLFESVFGLWFYPFSDVIIPGEDTESVEGIDTQAMTWTGDAFIFHGTYDPAVFNEEYSDEYEANERGAFTVYNDESSDTAYAVTENALLVAGIPDEESRTATEIVSTHLDSAVDGENLLVDTEDGEWLFGSTGESLIAVGTWQTEDVLGTLDPSAGNESTGNESLGNESTGNESADGGLDSEMNRIISDADSLINNLSATDANGDEIEGIEARFAAIYPDDAVPSEEDIRTHLIGGEDVDHTITIDGNHVQATATFENGMPE